MRPGQASKKGRPGRLPFFGPPAAEFSGIFLLKPIAHVIGLYRPDVVALPNGFALVERARATTGPHPMRRRSGEGVEARLRQCSLYDPALDLAVETADGEAAGYALFWFDPVTKVGLVEPMRVEDAYQRRGLARAMLTAGLDRLAKRGARRLKVGYGTDVARGLYVGAGFRVTSTSRSWRRRVARD